MNGSAAAATVLPPAIARPAAPAPSPWMASAGIDLTLFVAVTLTTLLPWLASDVFRVDGEYVLIGAAMFNGPHLISTWTRVYLPRGERFARPLHYWVIPGLLAAYAIWCHTAGGVLGERLIATTIFYWASWHFVSQSWGVLRIYQRKQGAIEGLDVKLEKALVFLPAMFFVLRRLFTGPRELFGSEVYHLRPSAIMVNALGAVILGLAAWYVVVVVRRRAAGKPIAFVRSVYLFFNAFGFAMPFLAIRDGTSAFAAAALWHAIQYVGIVWLYNRRRYSTGVDPDAHVVSWVSQPGRSFAYVGLLTLCAAGVYGVAFVAWKAFGRTGFLDWGLTLWTALTLGHYYLDGVIWKTRRYDLRPLAA